MEDRKVIFLVLITGLVAGVIGSFYIHLMHFVQHLVYAYSAADGLDFGQAVARVSTEHRLAALFGCGLVVGIGWVLIHRYGSPLVDIKTAVQDEKKTMPLVTTLVHATLQIITVGAGSPLGREVAPREASAGIMSAVVKHCNLTWENRALIIACAAGAGLAAVYNAPLSAAAKRHFILCPLRRCRIHFGNSRYDLQCKGCRYGLVIVRIGGRYCTLCRRRCGSICLTYAGCNGKLPNFCRYLGNLYGCNCSVL